MYSCGVLLAGGKSSRMGKNKSLLNVNDNRPVIQVIYDEIKQINEDSIIVTNHPDEYDFLQATMVGDRYYDMGPLAGLETAMYHIDAAYYMIAACDMPFINKQIYTYLHEQLQQHNTYDAVVPVHNNQIHPLAGIYKRNVLPHIQRQLEIGNLRVKSFFEDIHTLYIDSFSQFSQSTLKKHFFNMNNPEEFEQAKLL